LDFRRPRSQVSGARHPETRQAARSRDVTLAGFFEDKYLPLAKMNKAPYTVYTESYDVRRRLAPVADWPMSAIKPDDLERLVVAPMIEAGKSPRTIKRALDTLSVVWNTAKRMGVVSGDNPVTTAKRPRQDNKRVRFFSRPEAAALLAILKESCIDTHDICLLSLMSGLRLGECRSLVWADVNLEDGTIFVKDTKTKHDRHAYIIAEMREMFLRRYDGQAKSAPVFVNASGQAPSYSHLWMQFTAAVNQLGLNDGITDRRQKLVIHSCRHTFASWLVQSGKPLFTVSKLMGHSNIAMTMRYAHLAPDTQRAAAMGLEGAFNV
jgi:integrase